MKETLNKPLRGMILNLRCSPYDPIRLRFSLQPVVLNTRPLATLLQRFLNPRFSFAMKWMIIAIAAVLPALASAQTGTQNKAAPNKATQTKSAQPADEEPLPSGDEACGPLVNHFGPYDYVSGPRDALELVERYHFTSKVEELRGGQSAANAAGDIAYTLGAFPNHHRALMAISRLSLREKNPKPLGAGWPIECYFDRAIRFSPSDATPPLLYGIHLIRAGKPQLALQKMQTALELAGDNPNVHYNLGLAYLELKDYDNALKHAHVAYKLGFPLQGLRNRLEREGKWRDQ